MKKSEETGRTLSERTAKVILERAIELQARAGAVPAVEGDFSMEELKRIASESGIAGDFLEKALLEIEDEKTALTARRRNAFFGAPASIDLAASFPCVIEKGRFEEQVVPAALSALAALGPTTHTLVGDTLIFQHDGGVFGDGTPFTLLVRRKEAKIELELSVNLGTSRAIGFGGFLFLGFMSLAMTVAFGTLGRWLLSLLCGLGTGLSYLLPRLLWAADYKSEKRKFAKLIEDIGRKIASSFDGKALVPRSDEPDRS